MSFVDLERSGGGGGGRAASAGRDGDSNYIRSCEQVKKNIYDLDMTVKSIQKKVAKLDPSQGASQDNLRHDVGELQKKARTLVRETAGLIKRLGVDGSTEEETQQRREQQQKLTTDFRFVLNRFKEVQEQDKAKESSQLVSLQKTASTVSQHDGQGETEGSSLLGSAQLQQQQVALDREIEFNEEMIREREQGIKEITESMLEINAIFRDMATLVVDQGQQIDSIEASINTAAYNTQLGNHEVRKASKYQGKYRNRMCALLGFVLTLTTIIIILLVSGNKKSGGGGGGK